MLEQRTLLSVFTVTRSDDALDDAGNAVAGTLRHAILQSNETPGPNEIRFHLVDTIIATNPLPTITMTVTIDGRTEPGYTNAPLIRIDSLGVSNDAGLTIAADHVSVFALDITNWETGIVLAGAHAQVMGCYIGTDIQGELAEPNGTGILITGADAQIGSSTNPLMGNLISGNLDVGIRTSGNGTSALIVGNKIGTDVSGEESLGNGSEGIVLATAGNIVGGMIRGAGNLISGNGGEGLRITGASAHGNVVQGNMIGTDLNGMIAIPNETGVRIDAGASSNTIGGTVHANPGTMAIVTNTETGNVISGNTGVAIAMDGSGTNLNVIMGNWVGAAPSGLESLGNGGDGIAISSVANTIGGGTENPDLSAALIGASGNIIGGTVGGSANTIAFNGGNGVSVGSSLTDMSTGNSIRGNSIFSNLGLGIDLGGDGLPQGQQMSPHQGPNLLQNSPVLGLVVAGFTTTPIPFGLNGKAQTKFRIEFFASPSGNQGKTLVGQMAVTTDATGKVSATFSPSHRIAAGQIVTATATDPEGNTSEFSTPAQVTAITPLAPGSVHAAFAYSNANIPSIKLSWGAVANTGSYRIFRGMAAGAEEETAYATVNANSAPSYTDLNVLPGKTYYYDVVAVGTDTASAHSPETSAAVPHIAAPLKPGASVAGTAPAPKVVLSWASVAGANGYQVYRATSAGGAGQIALGTATSGIYTDTSVRRGMTYYYSIVALGYVEDSQPSPRAKVAVPLVLNSASWNLKNQTGTAPARADAVSAGSIAHPAYTLSLSGISGVVPIESFSWGVSNTSSSAAGGGGASKTTASDMTLTAPVTGASPALFYNAASGRHLTTGVLTAYDPAHKAYMTWTLNDIVVSSYSSQAGTDQFSLDFARLTAAHKGTHPITNAPLNTTTGWNFKTQTSTANALPGPAFDPAEPPAMTLTIGNGTSAQVSGFTFGSIASSPSNASSSTVVPVTVTAALGNGSPDLLAAALTGRHLKTVTLAQRDAAGKLIVSWILSDVVVIGDHVSGADGMVPKEVYKLSYASVTETTQAGGNRSGTVSASFNTRTDTATRPVSASGVPLGSVSRPGYVFTLSGITGVIPVNSFSWGVATTASTTGGGGGAGKTMASDLVLRAPVTGASPLLFYTAAVGIHSVKGVLTAYDGTGKAYMSWAMSDVLITSYSNQLGVDRVGLRFAKVTATHSGTNPVSGMPLETTAGWNFKSGSSIVTAQPGAAFAPASPPAISLSLGNGTSAVVSGFTFGGAMNSPSIAEVATFAPIAITAAVGNGSPDLLSAALTGRHLKTVTLAQRDGAGKLIASWTLGDVLVISNAVSGKGGSVPNEVFTLSYGTVMETTQAGGGKPGTVSANWNVRAKTGTAPASANAAPAASITQPGYTLSLSGITGVIPVQSFSWSVSTATSATSGGGGAGKASASDLTLTAPITGASPRLFFNTVTGTHLVKGILTAYDASGKAYMTWTMSDVLVTSYSNRLGIDSLSLNFAKLVAAHSGTNPITEAPFNTSTGWDFKSNHSTAHGLAGVAFDPASPPMMSLTLSNGTNAVVSGYNFGVRGSTGTSAAKFKPLTVTARLGNGSPDILFAALAGVHLKTVTLVQRDSVGKLIASWTLGDVLFVGNRISSTAGSGVPSEVYTLNYGTITETTPNGQF